MYIEDRLYSEVEKEIYYSVLLDESEMKLFSEFQKLYAFPGLGGLSSTWAGIKAGVGNYMNSTSGQGIRRHIRGLWNTFKRDANGLIDQHMTNSNNGFVQGLGESAKNFMNTIGQKGKAFLTPTKAPVAPVS